MSCLGSIGVLLGRIQWVLKVTARGAEFSAAKDNGCMCPSIAASPPGTRTPQAHCPTSFRSWLCWHQSRPTVSQAYFTSNACLCISTPTFKQKSVQLYFPFLLWTTPSHWCWRVNQDQIQMLSEISEDETLWCQTKAVILRVRFGLLWNAWLRLCVLCLKILACFTFKIMTHRLILKF